MVGVCVICHWQPTVTTDRQHLAMLSLLDNISPVVALIVTLRLLDNMLRLGDCWTTSLHCPAAVALIVTLCGNVNQGCWTNSIISHHHLWKSFDKQYFAQATVETMVD